MKCENCAYKWKEDGEQFACCHWESQAPGEFPPCEYDDYEEESDVPELWEE